ncbi:DotH/IcmK family type IV secretion protein [Brucella sp. NBRC 12950]|uniref:DotH/IcmK family type IV secretion protein n=1 Tax=Brucella sp. NBRC 12950 TaxID=2994518 RepID=UPI0024A5A359|nr:DotH/IcmK family type IV secretion protein [Brucella sp. NBRC 12950]GLU29921.1 type IV secretion system protein IcmK [Brucella sp. NBRC 12950]
MRTAILPALLLLNLLAGPAFAQSTHNIPVAVLPEQKASPQNLKSDPPASSKQDPTRFGQAPMARPSQNGSKKDELPPIIGTDRLLQSLDELDKPLSPEVITAYGAAVQSLMPMTPEMIRDYRKRVDDIEKAASEPPSGEQPRLMSDAIRLSLKPDQAVSAISTAPNTVSVISFYDRTGKAWPVASYVVGRADRFQVYALQEGSNKLAISALQSHGYSNLIVSLVEESRPIVLNLKTSQNTALARRDITVEGYGPNAAVNPTTVSAKVAPSDGVMMAFVQGAGLPKGAVQLRTTDPDTDVWTYSGDYFLRTQDTLVSPSWSSVLTGPGGVHAYRIKKSPVALISRNGTIERVRISN